MVGVFGQSKVIWCALRVLKAIDSRQTWLSRQTFLVRRRQGRFFESSRAVNIGWRFTARTKSWHIGPKNKDMTRRAFLNPRVIQAQRKWSSNRLVKKWCKWITIMEISQNLWVQLSSEQFSRKDQVASYPGMHSSCLSTRLRKSCTGA